MMNIIKIISMFMLVIFLIIGCTEFVSVPEDSELTDGEEVQIEEEALEEEPLEDGIVPLEKKDNPIQSEKPEQPKDSKERPNNQGDKEPKEPKENEKAPQYSVDQAISDNAQLTTIAFSGLAFLTGTEGADGFFPPGKVADFFGFQYMRDVDVSGYGHNTTFLTKIASNMLYILNDEQLDMLKELASEQSSLYEEFGMGRLVMIDAFRKHYEEGLTLNNDGVVEHSEELYSIDAKLSLNRAKVFGAIVQSFTDEQIDYIEAMSFNDSSTWPEIDEEGLLDKRSMSHLEHVAVMTYASELFSWYAGSLEADVYFCPERHGTYFGGFYMKDYPAMGNPDYFISTSITGDSGKEFLEILTEEQRILITSIIEEQKPSLERIVEIRQLVSEALRSLMTEETLDEALIMELLNEYGTLEGEMSLLYATRFAEVGKMLTEDQMEKLIELRNQNVYPEGAYLYSSPIPMPADMDSSDLIE